MVNCPICLDSVEHPVCAPCGHIYCGNCWKNYLDNEKKNNSLVMHLKCTICQEHIPIGDEAAKTSTREIRALMEHVMRPVFVEEVQKVKEATGDVQGLRVENTELKTRVAELEKQLSKAEATRPRLGLDTRFKPRIRRSETMPEQGLEFMKEEAEKAKAEYRAVVDLCQSLRESNREAHTTLNALRAENERLKRELSHAKPDGPSNWRLDTSNRARLSSFAPRGIGFPVPHQVTPYSPMSPATGLSSGLPSARPRTLSHRRWSYGSVSEGRPQLAGEPTGLQDGVHFGDSCLYPAAVCPACARLGDDHDVSD